MDWESILDTVVDWCVHTGIKVIISILVIFIAFAIINLVMRRIGKRLEKSKKMDKTISKSFVNIIRVVLKIIVAVAVIGYLGIDTSSVTAVIASTGVGLGLALNGALSNFAGGILILATRPFKEDDFIEVCGYSGFVEAIRITTTKIRTYDNKVVYLPNGTLSGATIVNYSEKDIRRVDHKFSISYTEDFERAKKVIFDVCDSFEFILKDPPISVGIASHSQSSIDLFTRVWCKNDDYWTVYNYLLEAVKKAFDENKIEIPFNQLDVHIKQN